MYTVDTFLRLGTAYSSAFDRFNPAARLTGERLHDYQAWIEANPDYQPQFSSKMAEAKEWVSDNEHEFDAMVQNLGTGILFLNDLTEPFPESDIYPNISEFLKTRKDDALLPTNIDGHAIGSNTALMKAVIDSARRLRLGETIRPADGQYYGYHLYTKTPRGMVSASILDLYENYSRTLGLYPEQSTREAVIANALTEAIHATRPDGPLFDALQDKADGWIFGYSGFSDEFQKQVYPA